MKNASVVIGANFGDEGKGLMTDYLAAKYSRSMVIRFNGGAQAGHTVTTPSGERHVFSHFGSGTFAGASTFLSDFFVHNPLLFFKELSVLNAAGVRPVVYADPKGIITTPYDMMVNQIAERRRGAGRHGSCGVGFNETIQRNLDSRFGFTIADLLDMKHVAVTVDNIRRHYIPARLEELGFGDEYQSNRDIFTDDGIFQNFLNDVQEFHRRIGVATSQEIAALDLPLIFEGAQGLLLDENHQWFPHVTRSSTGLKNVIHLADKMGIDELSVNYMTRCYLTRHGAGPMPGELNYLPYRDIVDKTNIPNDWQGSLRFAFLDGDLLKNTIADDLKHATGYMGKVSHRIVVTCMDQRGDDGITVVMNDRKVMMDVEEFIAHMRNQHGDCAFSYGPTRTTLEG
jgi:adenylosuccinate synthase